MNFIHIAGHLGADPEVRFTSTGKKVTHLKVASRSRKGKGGEDVTIWWRVTLWGEQFDKLLSFMKKGSAVIIHGEIHKPEIFTDREGTPQISLDVTAFHIEFSPFGKPGGSQPAAGEGQQPAHAASTAPFGAHPGSHPSAEPPVVNPYLASAAAASQGKGETYDDEVPF